MALAISLGAFLLFVVQPISGRLLLPRFGGAAGAWVACLLFFQATVLVGYWYADLVCRRLPLAAQARTHIALLGAATLLLVMRPPAAGIAGPGGDSVADVVRLLATSVGVPGLVLAAGSPLLQRWFVVESGGQPPYRLFAVSNAASLAGLVAYPFVIEPAIGLKHQAAAWTWLFGAFAAATAWNAAAVIRHAQVGRGTRDTAEPGGGGASPGAGERFTWAALAAAGSSLLLATTNQLSLDISGFPFVWVVPLALYLLTFIVCFDHSRWYQRRVVFTALAVAVPLAVGVLVAGNRASFWLQLVAYGAALAACCMACHGELVRRKPAPAFVTSFYLAIASGGLIGGLFVTLIAPLAFRGFWELHVSLVAGCTLPAMAALDDRRVVPTGRALLVAYAATLTALVLLAAIVAPDPRLWQGHGKYLAAVVAALLVAGAGVFGDLQRNRRGEASRWYRVALPAALLALPVALLLQIADFSRDTLHGRRSFYGLIRVMEWRSQDVPERSLVHGYISHGKQYVDPRFEDWPTAYYGTESGVGVALRHLTQRAGNRPVRIGVVGLGVGTLATYGRPGDTVRFYELDPAVAEVAGEYFSFLAQSPAEIQLVIGDARLRMEEERSLGELQRFDLLAVDAFLGDAIPVHLLTAEAIALYREHLAGQGLLALHLSSRLLDLPALAHGLAARHGLRAVLVHSPGRAELGTFDATWVILAGPDNPFFATAGTALSRWPEDIERRSTVWTDDHASLWRLFRRRGAG